MTYASLSDADCLIAVVTMAIKHFSDLQWELVYEQCSSFVTDTICLKFADYQVRHKQLGQVRNEQS